MSILVKKFNRAKWSQIDKDKNISSEDIFADAITHCMKTAQNTLSTWKIQTRDNLEEAVLAIVSSHQHLDAFDIVCFDSSSLEAQGIKLEKNPGETPIKHLVDKHIDISNLTYKSLGILANNILNELKQDKTKRYTTIMLKNILNDAINEGILEKDKLKEDVRKKL